MLHSRASACFQQSTPLFSMRGVTSLLRASRLQSGAFSAQGQHACSKMAGIEPTGTAQASTMAALRSHACAWKGMHSFASAASTVRGTQALGISGTVYRATLTEVFTLNRLSVKCHTGHAKTADNRQQQSAIPTSFCIQHAGLWTNSRGET